MNTMLLYTDMERNAELIPEDFFYIGLSFLEPFFKSFSGHERVLYSKSNNMLVGNEQSRNDFYSVCGSRIHLFCLKLVNTPALPLLAINSQGLFELIDKV